MALALIGNFSVNRFFSDGLRLDFQQMQTKVKAKQAKRAVYRTTLNELIALSDRELADIGIHRSHVRRVAKEQAAKEYPNV